jgi:hypothetical protein
VNVPAKEDRMYKERSRSKKEKKWKLMTTAKKQSSIRKSARLSVVTMQQVMKLEKESRGLIMRSLWKFGVCTESYKEKHGQMTISNSG